MISVITPTYFRNERLERAIKSVRSQTFDDVEHIVIDGSEEKHAQDVVDRYDDVQYLAPEIDPGLHKCRELGVRHANGEFIQFLDDDDWLKPRKLELSLQEMTSDVDVVYCGVERSNGNRVTPDDQAEGNVLRRALAFDMFPAVPSTWLIDRWLIEEMLPFRHSAGADDEGTHIEMAQLTEYAYVDDALVVLGDDTEESFSGTWEYVNGIDSLTSEYAELYDAAPDTVESKAREKVHRARGTMYLRDSFWTLEATREFVKAARMSPEKRALSWGLAITSLAGRPGPYLGNKVLELIRS